MALLKGLSKAKGPCKAPGQWPVGPRPGGLSRPLAGGSAYRGLSTGRDQIQSRLDLASEIASKAAFKFHLDSRLHL